MNNHVISSVALGATINSEKNNSGANFTLKSIKTGKEYSYKIIRSQYNGNWYTHIKVETGYQNFKRLGTYYKGKIRNKKEVINSPSAVAIAFVLDKVEHSEFNYLDERMQLMHQGKCLCCGKPLTDSHSIEIGLGPICANR